MGEEDLTPSQEEQRNVLSLLLNRSLHVGETWYLVDASWMKSLKLYLGLSGASFRNTQEHPGPIDNRILLNPDNSLKTNIVEVVDYEAVPQELWNKLVEWYSIKENQAPISRKVIQISPQYKTIEIQLVKLKCSIHFSMESSCPMAFSRATPVKTVDEELRLKFNIDEHYESRLWFSTPGSEFEVVDMDKLLSDVVAQDGNCVVLESKKPNNRWNDRNEEFSKKNSLNNENELSSYSNAKVSRLTSPNQPGVCGLTNLGNTCFMNSVLQCMSNCPPVTEYFLAGRHNEELNEVNPLGMKGQIALVFGQLIGTMWSGKDRSTSPIQFKVQLGKFNPVFSGFQQHDSQELLTFLLDGLHEDLNRIKKKPYTEISDDSDREDKILAQEAWDRHRKRNDSIIVDTFHGLLKSTVVCPDCKKKSVTFDPFCNLSLPLPQKKDRPITITYIPFGGNKNNFKCRVSIPRQGIIKDLCREVGQRASTDPNNRLLVAEMTNSHFHKFYDNEDTLDNTQDRDVLYVYEIPEHCNDSDPQQLLIPVCFWEIDGNPDKFNFNQLFGVPFFVTVPKQPLSEHDLRLFLLEKMNRHFNIPPLNGYTSMDIDNESLDFAMKDAWFRIYITNMSTPPSLLDFNNKTIDLTELFDVEDSSEMYFGRNVMVLGLTKELKKEVYIEKPIEVINDKSYSHRQASNERERITLNECVNLFTTCEKLGADDAWYCPACKKHQRATKKFDLWDLPKILILHLKRFSYTRLLRDKIVAMVDCPLKNLKMTVMKRDRPHRFYNLIGVCNHYGGMGGGHYTASCKNKDTGEWHIFDDSTVQPISENQVLTPAAYVLFYQATDVQ